MEVVTLPKLGISDEGELLAWEFEVGDELSAGDHLVTFESEKASAEVDAPVDGVLLATYFEAGDIVEIEPGHPIAAIGDPGEEPPTYEELTDGDGASARAGAPTGGDGGGGDSESPDDGDATDDGGSEQVKATPRAKRYAREAGVDLAAVEGTGPQGAVTESDVEAYEESSAAAEESTDEAPAETAETGATADAGASTEATEGSADGELTVVERRELSGTRRTIANRLSESAREKPHVMGTREIGIERAEALVERLGEDVGLNDLLVLAVAETLGDLPEFNARFRDGAHELLAEVNLGYAVDTEKGLVVPVLRNADEKDVESLSAERREAVDRALADDHEPADLRGGTFTVTNVGVFGMDVSYSIINPPQVAILALGRRKPVPVERDGDVEFERGLTASLTIDHRVLDGSDSGAFLARLDDYLQHPASLIDGLPEE